MNNPASTTENTARSNLGSVGKLDDGRSFVLFERLLPHSIDIVWAAITQPEQLANWCPGFKPELRHGGRFDIWFGGDCEGPAHVSGTVTRYEPPNVLECGSLRFELVERGSECLLTFTDILHFEGTRTNRELTNSVLGGWHRFLDALAEALAGKLVDHETPELDYAKFEVPGRE